MKGNAKKDGGISEYDINQGLQRRLQAKGSGPTTVVWTSYSKTHQVSHMATRIHKSPLSYSWPTFVQLFQSSVLNTGVLFKL